MMCMPLTGLTLHFQASRIQAPRLRQVRERRQPCAAAHAPLPGAGASVLQHGGAVLLLLLLQFASPGLPLHLVQHGCEALLLEGSRRRVVYCTVGRANGA